MENNEIFYILIAVYFCCNCFILGRRWDSRLVVKYRIEDLIPFIVGFLSMTPFVIIDYLTQSNAE